MANLKKRYRDLEMEVMASLRDAINNSDTESKHVQSKAIKVNVFDYTEMVYINDNLTFLDDKGMHYSLWNGDCNIEDLIDILSQLNLEN